MWSTRTCRYRRKRLLALFLILPSIGTMCLLLYMVESTDSNKSIDLGTPEMQVYGGSVGKGQRQLLVPNKPNERQPKSHAGVKSKRSKRSNNPSNLSNNNRPIYKMQDRKIQGEMPNKNWNDIPDEYRVNEYDAYDDEGYNDNKNVNNNDKTKDFYNAQDVESVVIEDNDEDDDEEYDYAIYNPSFKNGDFDAVNSTNSSVVNNNAHDAHSKDDKESRSSLKGQKDNIKPISRQLKNSITRNGAESHDKKLLRQTLPPNVDTERSKNKNNSSHFYHKDKDNLLSHQEPATQIQLPLLWKPQRNEVRNYAGFPIVVDRIFWSSQVEEYVPRGITSKQTHDVMSRMREGHAHVVSPPSWDRCGHNKNRFVTLDDGMSLCARYRDPHIKLVYGELLSFHLSRYLGLDNIPVVVLSWTNSTAPLWRNHQPSETGWEDGKLLALIQWINNLNTPRSRVHLPPVILDAYKNNSTLSWNTRAVRQVPVYELADLLQWSDLIVYDYITGHYDRLASMQDGSEKEGDITMLEDKIRNLQRDVKTGKMWLIDNESGLFDAYELLYMGKELGTDFINYHKKMLKSICIFRKDLIDKIRSLADNPFPDEVLFQYAWAREPVLSEISKPPQYYLFAKHFRRRLLDVLEWVNVCRTR